MAARVVVDPVTRIEGHLRVEAILDEPGVIHDAVSSGTMWRGIELILQGRDPRDAWAFCERICGVCTTVHALASVRAVENALGIHVPRNADVIRNMMFLTQMVQDHVIHFYHLHALDWVDIVSALKASPEATATLAQNVSPAWPLASPGYIRDVAGRLKKFVDSGQLGIFQNAYWGHPAYKLPPEANLMAVSHYLEALKWQKEIIKVHAIFGGKNPHPNYLVGGSPVDAFLAAGHVSTVMGYEEYEPLSRRWHVPIVVTGFEPLDLLEGIDMAVAQLESGRAEVENQYSRAVRREGNRPAQQRIAEVFEVSPRKWRGIGEIPASGLRLCERYLLSTPTFGLPQAPVRSASRASVSAGWCCKACASLSSARCSGGAARPNGRWVHPWSRQKAPVPLTITIGRPSDEGS